MADSAITDRSDVRPPIETLMGRNNMPRDLNNLKKWVLNVSSVTSPNADKALSKSNAGAIIILSRRWFSVSVIQAMRNLRWAEGHRYHSTYKSKLLADNEPVTPLFGFATFSLNNSTPSKIYEKLVPPATSGLYIPPHFFAAVPMSTPTRERGKTVAPRAARGGAKRVSSRGYVPWLAVMDRPLLSLGSRPSEPHCGRNICWDDATGPRVIRYYVPRLVFTARSRCTRHIRGARLVSPRPIPRIGDFSRFAARGAGPSFAVSAADEIFGCSFKAIIPDFGVWWGIGFEVNLSGSSSLRCSCGDLFSPH